MEESKLTPPCYNLALFLPISQLCSSLENQQLCNYGSCENQQPVSHRRDQKERGAPHKPCLWRTVTTCPMTTLWKALSSEIVFTWSDSKLSSFQFSRSVVSNSLRPHEPQHARLPCPSPTPGVHPNPCPLSRWCHPTVSSCCPLLLLPSIFPSIRVFSNESALHIRWPKYWSFRFSISPSSEHPGLISFRMDWLDLLAIQGTLKSLLQHHSSKASIFRHSAGFCFQVTLRLTWIIL